MYLIQGFNTQAKPASQLTTENPPRTTSKSEKNNKKSPLVQLK